MAEKSEVRWTNLGDRRIAKLKPANFPNADAIVRQGLLDKKRSADAVDILLVNPPTPDGGLWIRTQHRVGRRTRELVGGFKPQDWEGPVAAEAVERAAAGGAFGARTEQLVKAFPGRPRTAVLSGIALFHSAGHMGEATTVRTAGGFGTGV